MKLDNLHLILVVVIILLGFNSFRNCEEQPEPEPVTITIPEETGTTGEVEFEEVEVDTVYLKGDTEYVEVDKGYKELYENAKDSLEKAKLYYEAIQIREYDSTIVDNDDITIVGGARVRGSLLAYSVDYKIKEKPFTYTPEIYTKLPRLTGGVGFELAVPTVVGENFALKGNISLMNQKGHKINLGYDTDQRIWLGYERIFTLIK